MIQGLDVQTDQQIEERNQIGDRKVQTEGTQGIQLGNETDNS